MNVCLRSFSVQVITTWRYFLSSVQKKRKEKYTEILPEHFKKALLQFRIGSHKLPVNNRKHFNVPRADRHCTHCDQSLMGDEIHFLYECPKLNNLRACLS